MPVHDWTRADDGLFHDFHYSWLWHLRDVLNGGLLPPGYYAMAEQHAGGDVPQRRLAVRDNRRVVAVIEVVSPNNKNREGKVQAFAEKAADLIRAGIHLAVIDVLPPGRHDPGGVHPAVWAALADDAVGDPAPADRPLTFAGYRAEEPPDAYLSYAAVGQPLPPVPLYLDGDVFVELPLEETYTAAYTRLPAELKAVLG
jgi:hypothetical protein